MADPILIIKDSTFCYGALYNFAIDLGAALERLGQDVEYFDFSSGNIGLLDQFLGRSFSAVIGFQSPLFHAYLPDISTYIVDYIQGPKLQMMLDNPLGLPNLVEKAPKDYYILTHDRDYKSYVDTFFPAVQGSFILPPGANVPSTLDNICETGLTPILDRDIPVLFLGTYVNYRQFLPGLLNIHGSGRRIAGKYLSLQTRNPHQTPYELLDLTLAALNIGDISLEQKKNLLMGLKDINRCISFYYKEKTIHALLSAGIPVTVVSDSWTRCPDYSNPNLTVLPSVDYSEIPALMQQSKICLNIMTAHKDGVTERIAQGLLAGCVTISDETRSLKEQFSDDEMLLFRLENIDSLPAQIASLLSDSDRMTSMSANGYKKAHNTLSWDVRANELVHILFG